MIDRTQIEAALAKVYDPCSVQASAPLSVVNMGLVTQIDVESCGTVQIRMRPTSPWCTMIGCIMQAMEEQVRNVTGVTGVNIQIDQGKPWSEADLTPVGRDILQGVRARSRAAVPVRRRQWQERVSTTEEA